MTDYPPPSHAAMLWQAPGYLFLRLSRPHNASGFEVHKFPNSPDGWASITRILEARREPTPEDRGPTSPPPRDAQFYVHAKHHQEKSSRDCRYCAAEGRFGFNPVRRFPASRTAAQIAATASRGEASRKVPVSYSTSLTAEDLDL